MKVSEKGINLIKEFEGLRLDAYQCSASVWTIGYGHTSGVKSGNRVTELEADKLLREDVANAERAVREGVNVPLNQDQYDALVSFAFNIGSGNFWRSTLIKKLNTGDYIGASEEFSRWVHGGEKKLPGLVRRRKKERDLFLGEVAKD